MICLILALVASLFITGCTITVTPLPPAKKHHQYAKHSKSRHIISKTRKKNAKLIVDSDWLMQYRQLEEEHGNYVLRDDSKVESAGEGKYKVTHAMLEHFKDLSQTPVVTPTP